LNPFERSVIMPAGCRPLASTPESFSFWSSIGTGR